MGASCTCTVSPVVVEHDNRIQVKSKRYNIRKKERGDRWSEMSISSCNNGGVIYLLQLSAVVFDPVNSPQWADFVIDKCIIIVDITLQVKPSPRLKSDKILTGINVDWGKLCVSQQVPRVSSMTAGNLQIFGVLSSSCPSMTSQDRITLHATLLGMQDISLSTEVKTDKAFLIDDVTAMYQCFMIESEAMIKKNQHLNLQEEHRKISSNSRKSSVSKKDSMTLDVIVEEQEVPDTPRVECRKMINASEFPADAVKMDRAHCAAGLSRAGKESVPATCTGIGEVHLGGSNDKDSGNSNLLYAIVKSKDLPDLRRNRYRGASSSDSGLENKKKWNTTDDEKYRAIPIKCKQPKVKTRKLTPIVKNNIAEVLRSSSSKDMRLEDLREEQTDRHYPFDFSSSDVWETDSYSNTAASTPSRFNVSPFSLK